MKAVYIEKPGAVVIREKEIPKITADDQVIIKIKYAGICGSEMAIYKGTNPFVVYPKIFGHEFTGEVVEKGADVRNVSIGDHVVGEPMEYCGQCYACRNGHPNVCEKLQVYGVHMDGGGQAYIRMAASKVYRISSQVPWECAVLAEPLTIGFQSSWRGDVRKDDSVLVMGAGTIGLCAVMAAKERGARVISMDRHDRKLEYAKKLGADEVIHVKKHDLKEEIMRITEGEGVNVVLDTVGTKESLEQAIMLTSTAGRVVELGFEAKTYSELYHAMIFKKELSVMGTRLQVHQFPEAIAYLEKHWNKLEDFVTKIYPAEKAEEAFQYITENRSHVRKVLIEF